MSKKTCLPLRSKNKRNGIKNFLWWFVSIIKKSKFLTSPEKMTDKLCLAKAYICHNSFIPKRRKWLSHPDLLSMLEPDFFFLAKPFLGLSSSSSSFILPAPFLSFLSSPQCFLMVCSQWLLKLRILPYQPQLHWVISDQRKLNPTTEYRWAHTWSIVHITFMAVSN